MPSQEHNCAEIKCSGSKFAGLNINCSRCLIPKYIECISDRTEIAFLLNALKIEQSNAVNRIDNVNKIQQLIFSDSLIEFVCPSCKKKDTYIDIKMKLDAEKEKLDKKTKSSSNEIRNLKKKIKDLEDEIKIKIGVIDSLKLSGTSTSTSSQEINELNSKLSLIECQVKSKFESIESITNEFNLILTTEQSRFEHFVKHVNESFGKASESLNTLIRCVSNSEISPTDSGENESNGMSSQLNQDIHKPDPVLRVIEGFRQMKGGLSNFAKPIGSSGLSQKANRQNTRQLHEIYVSPFGTEVECDQIEQHIMNNTTVNDVNTFVVEKLGVNLKRKSFISFKISTLNHDVCECILNDHLWSPNQTARLFQKHSPKTNANNNKNSRNFDTRYKIGQNSYNEVRKPTYQRQIHPRERPDLRNNRNMNFRNMNYQNSNYQNSNYQNKNYQNKNYQNRNYQNRNYQSDYDRNFNNQRFYGHHNGSVSGLPVWNHQNYNQINTNEQRRNDYLPSAQFPPLNPGTSTQSVNFYPSQSHNHRPQKEFPQI